jgi:hypothetical protein
VKRITVQIDLGKKSSPYLHISRVKRAGDMAQAGKCPQASAKPCV